MNATSTSRCTCRGYDPADPCGHGDTSDGCPVHDPDYFDDSSDWEDEGPQ